MSQTKEIQRRIKSITNTKKITSAMEMVAATKMKRAISAVLSTRTYANLGWETILNLSSIRGISKQNNMLGKKKNAKKVAIVLITSNRGLCAGFNNKIIEKTYNSIQLHKKNIKGEDVETEFILLGKKGTVMYKNYGYKIVGDFEKPDLASKVSDVSQLSKFVLDEFRKNNFDKIMVAYTDFVSPSVQIPRVKQILPIDIDSQDEYLGIMGKDTRAGIHREYIEEKKEKHLQSHGHDYTFEPNPSEVLEQIVPRLIEVQLLQALLESNASEHSTRMNAMHQATDSAKELVEELTLYYNKARQASITAEIAEISAGAVALSN